MIYFDVTKTGSAGHRSGLTRVSSRLRAELGGAAVDARWDNRSHSLTSAHRAKPQAGDWFFTAELFSESERTGFTAFLTSHACRLAAVFHDAIPLKHPHITWPQSVARHPGYMKLLARFDRIWAVSNASRDELLGFWRWQGMERPPPVDVLMLGADFDAQPRVTWPRPLPTARPHPPALLCVGILEPRKNQSFLLDVCEQLWRTGLEFELHLVGRLNPHFGGPIAARIKALSREFRGLRYHAAASDQAVANLYARAHATVLPTIAEGCGLPLLESLWRGVPCVCSDLPVLRENADAGGCVPVTVNDRNAWTAALRRILTAPTDHAQLVAQAVARPLPTWADAARSLSAAMRTE